MSKTKIIILAILLINLGLFSSCSDDDYCGQVYGFTNGTVDEYDNCDLNNVTATLSVFHVFGMPTTLHGLPVEEDIDISNYHAVFNNNSYNSPINAGDVFVNGNKLKKINIDSTNQDLALYSSLDLPIFTDGTPYKWEVSGSEQFSAFSEEINSPEYEMQIISPEKGSEISKSDSLVILWDNKGKPADEITTFITDEIDLAYARANDMDSRLAMYLSRESIYASTDDEGSLALTPAALDYFDSNQTLYIVVSCYNRELKKLSNGKFAFLSVDNTHIVPIKLVD